jgi:MYXO-CTERM domain-containing protein
VQLLVTQDTTSITLGSSVNPSVINQSVTFTATVTGSNAAPTGTVSFYDGTTLLGTGTLSASTTANVSTATFSTSVLGLGSHNITAVYANTLDFGPSTSAILVQVVNLIPSTTTITGIVSPIYYGQIIGDTAFINVVGFSTGGTTAVYIDNVLVCTLPVIAGQTNSCPPSTGAGYNVGVHTIYAMYSGDPQYAPSTSPVYSVTILPDNTTTTVISSQNPSKQTQPVTFTATVSAPYATPVGTVNFYSNGVLIGAANLNTSGVANVTTNLLAAGADNITAVYTPSTNNFNPSTSAVLVQQVNPLIPRFEITITPNPLNIAVNSTGTATLTVTDYDGFNQPVTLTCSGITTETTCNFAQLLTPAGGGSTTVTLSPAPPHNCKVTQAENASPRGPATWLALVGLAMLLTRRRRRLFQALALAALLVGLMPIVNGCGNCTDLGVLPGAYTVTITGTSTGTPVQTSSTTVTMNVQY